MVSATTEMVAESGTTCRTPPARTAACASVSTDALLTSTAVGASGRAAAASAPAITARVFSAASASPAERLLVGPPLA
jgi:hypothetical protein